MASYYKRLKRDLAAASAGGLITAGQAGDGIWVRGDKRRRWGPGRLYYGIEKYFVGENSPLKDAGSGDFSVRVKVDGLGNLRLLKLIGK